MRTTQASTKMAAMPSLPSGETSVYAGCDLADDGASIFTATTLVGSEAGTVTARRPHAGGSRDIQRDEPARQRSVTATQAAHPAPPRQDADNLSLTSDTSTLRNLPRPPQPRRDLARGASHDPARPLISDRMPSGISYSRANQRVGPTDYVNLEDLDSTPVQLRRASIDSTATDMLQRSAAAASQDDSLVVPWWNAMLPSPLMNRPLRPGSTSQPAAPPASGRKRESSIASAGNTSSDAQGGSRTVAPMSVHRGGAAQQGSSSNAGPSRPSLIDRAMSLTTSTMRTPQQESVKRPVPSRQPTQPTNYSSDVNVNVVPPVDPTFEPTTLRRQSAAPRMEQESSRSNTTPTSRARTKSSVPQAGSETRSKSAPRRNTTLTLEQPQEMHQGSMRQASSQHSHSRPNDEILVSEARRADKQRAIDTSRGVRPAAGPGSSQRSRGTPMRPTPKKTGPTPPAIPPAWSLYARCYCEENAYLLAAHLLFECQKRNKRAESLQRASEGDVVLAAVRQWTVDVVFVSNDTKTVALWQQRASALRDAGYVVVWDYHVFVAVTCQPSKGEEASHVARSQPLPRQTWAYDVDSHMPAPVRLADYLKGTFRQGTRDKVAELYQPRFRIVPAIDFLAHFASDRSHMWMPDGRWSAEPPMWTPIRGPFAKVRHNLMDKYVDLSGGTQGIVIGNIVPTAEEARTFGIVVSLTELAQDKQITGLACFGRSAKAASRKEDDLDFVIDKAVRQLLAEHGHMTPKDGGDHRPRRGLDLPVTRRSTLDDSPWQSDDAHEVEPAPAPAPKPNRDSYLDGQPGMLLGGTRRVYGVRPPPAPPGHDPLHHRPQVNFSGRGKRVSNALFPAYLHASLESRAERERAVAAASRATAASHR